MAVALAATLAAGCTEAPDVQDGLPAPNEDSCSELSQTDLVTIVNEVGEHNVTYLGGWSASSSHADVGWVAAPGNVVHLTGEAVWDETLLSPERLQLQLGTDRTFFSNELVAAGGSPIWLEGAILVPDEGALRVTMKPSPDTGPTAGAAIVLEETTVRVTVTQTLVCP